MSYRLMAPLTRKLSKRWAVQSGALPQPPPPSNSLQDRECAKPAEMHQSARDISSLSIRELGAPGFEAN